MEQTSTNNFKQAKEELEAVCEKYGISLVPVVVHQGDRTFSSIEIVPRQPQVSSQEEAPAAE
jgi:hypothetical protein